MYSRPLAHMWVEKHDTAARTLRRIKAVFDYCQASGYRTTIVNGVVIPLPNPCDGVRAALPKSNGVEKHHEALPYPELPGFIQKLRTSPSALCVKLAFEFLISDVRANWRGSLCEMGRIRSRECSLDCPAARMKMKVEHKVPLSARCIEILNLAKQFNDSAIVFPGRKAGEPLSNAAFLMALRRMGYEEATAHGFRATFKTWAEEKTKFDSLVIEAWMAHAVKGIERHYLRTTFFEQRKKLMEAWGIVCNVNAGKQSCKNSIIHFQDIARMSPRLSQHKSPQVAGAQIPIRGKRVKTIDFKEGMVLKQQFADAATEFADFGAIWHSWDGAYYFRDFVDLRWDTGKDASPRAKQRFSSIATRAAEAAGYDGGHPIETWLNEVRYRLDSRIVSQMWESDGRCGVVLKMEKLFQASDILVEALLGKRQNKARRGHRSLTEREKIIRAAIREGVRGRNYASYLDNYDLPTQKTWQMNPHDPCPKTHVEAFDSPYWREIMKKRSLAFMRKPNSPAPKRSYPFNPLLLLHFSSDHSRTKSSESNLNAFLFNNNDHEHIKTQ